LSCDCHLDPFAFFGWQIRRRKRVLQRAEHQSQRRAELVADVREEQRLRPIDLGQRLAAAALVFISTCVRNRRGDLRARQSKEVAVSFIKSKPGADARNQKSGKLVRFV